MSNRLFYGIKKKVAKKYISQFCWDGWNFDNFNVLQKAYTDFRSKIKVGEYVFCYGCNRQVLKINEEWRSCCKGRILVELDVECAMGYLLYFYTPDVEPKTAQQLKDYYKSYMDLMKTSPELVGQGWYDKIILIGECLERGEEVFDDKGCFLPKYHELYSK